MNGVGAGDFGGADDGRHIQIAVGTARRSDADVFIGKAHVQRVLVGFRVNGNGLDAELARGADDAQRDLPAVGNKDLFEHHLPRGAAPRPPLHALSRGPRCPAPFAWLALLAVAGFAPRTPLHALSRGPRCPAPFAWLALLAVAGFAPRTPLH